MNETACVLFAGSSGGRVKMKYFWAVWIRGYNFIISRKIINKNRWFYRKLRVWLHSHICRECHVCFGKKNPDRTFYVIRCPKNDLGFFGLFNFVVFHLKRAEELGASPVIDLKYYPNDYMMEDKEVGKVNCWEYYFRQATDVDIEEVYHSKSVIMSSGGYSPSLAETEDEEELVHSHELVKKYMKPQQFILEIFEQKYQELGMKNRRILGVKCRGTDFSQTRPSKHQIVPDARQTISVIEEKELEWGGFDKIFVATEDQQIYAELKEKYGERMISNDEKLIGNVNGKWLNEMFRGDSLKGSKRERMTEYLVSILLLSRCDALIGPVIGGVLGAMRLKGHYEYVYLFHLGAYE